MDTCMAGPKCNFGASGSASKIDTVREREALFVENFRESLLQKPLKDPDEFALFFN